MLLRAEPRSLRPLLAFALLPLLLPVGAPLLEGIRLLDSGICAQLPTHMLMPGGVALPLCARNTGIYTGAALAFGIRSAQGRQRAMAPPPAACVALLLTLIGLMALDGLNSVAVDLGLPHLYQPSNTLRLATGLGAGLAIALLLSPVIARARFGAADHRPPLEGWSALLPYGGAAVLAFLIIRSAAAWTLYPVALLSNVGLLAVLAGANVIAWSAIEGLHGNTAVVQPRVPTLTVVCLAELALLAGMRILFVLPAGTAI